MADRAADVAAAAGQHEHRRAVARRAVPGLEVKAIGGGELHRLVLGARRVARGAVERVDVDDRHADGQEEEDHREQAERDRGDPDRPALDGACAALAAVAERDPAGEADEHDAGGEREHAGDVIGRRALVDDVVRVAATVHSREDAERERGRRACARPQRAEPQDGGDGGDDRDRQRERVPGERDAGAGQQERVVEGVRECQHGGGAEHDGLRRTCAKRGHAGKRAPVAAARTRSRQASASSAPRPVWVRLSEPLAIRRRR